MSITPANPVIDILTRELITIEERVAALSAQLRDAKSAAQSIRAAIAQLSGTTTNAWIDTTSAPRRGGLVDRILEILEDAGDAGISPQQISERLTAGGRPTTKNTVASTLARMKQEGLADGRMRQWFKARVQNNSGDHACNENEPHSIETGGSDAGISDVGASVFPGINL